MRNLISIPPAPKVDQEKGEIMICNSCKTEIQEGLNGCPSCGADQSKSRSKVSGGIQGILKKLVSKRTNLLAFGGAIVLIASLIFVFSPKTVTVNIEIKASNGGVFTQDCKITTSASYLIDDNLVAVAKSDKKKVSKAKVDWFSDRGKCLGTAKVSVSPFETYSLYAGESLVGAIKDGQGWGGSIDGYAEVAVKHSLDVKMSLVIKAGSCSGDAAASWSCSGIYGLYTDTDTGTCHGIGGYSDIKMGTKIIVTGKSNKKTVQGELDEGASYDLDSTSSKKITCTIFAKDTFEIDHDDEGYFVTIADRGDVYFTNEDLDAEGWNAGLRLGD